MRPLISLRSQGSLNWKHVHTAIARIHHSTQALQMARWLPPPPPARPVRQIDRSDIPANSSTRRRGTFLRKHAQSQDGTAPGHASNSSKKHRLRLCSHLCSQNRNQARQKLEEGILRRQRVSTAARGRLAYQLKAPRRAILHQLMLPRPVGCSGRCRKSRPGT